MKIAEKTLLNSFNWRKFFFLVGIGFLLLGCLLPVKSLVSRAISPDIVELIQERGTPERIVQLREQFETGLGFLRIASGVLGLWFLLIGGIWKHLLKGTSEATIADGKTGMENIKIGKEIMFPVIWMLLVIIICIPLLYKGFESIEVVNLEMLARRGPLVTMACQNLAPRAAQPGFTVVESIFVKIFGEAEPVARMPALLFGALAMFPVFFIARRYGPVLFANLTCTGLAVTGFYLFYNTYARGYALALTAYLLCVFIAFLLRERSTWPRWAFFAFFMVIGGYAHLASGLYVVCLLFFVMLDRSVKAWRRKPLLSSIVKACIQPVVSVGTAVLVLFFLLSVAIPTSISYMKEFSLTDYYTSYHVNLHLLKVMTESWAWVRDCSPIAWAQFVLFVVGAIWAFRRLPWNTVYLIAAPTLAITLIWSQGMYVFTRYLLHFLPIYVLFSMFSLWQLFLCRSKLNRKIATTILVFLLIIIGIFSLKRLYIMERCGVRTAIDDAHAVMSGNDKLMAVLDSYVIAKHYHSDVVSGYKDKDFWKEIEKEEPPEYLINVPYIEFDLPGGTQAILEKYDLFKKYPSWIDVNDDQDAVYLYRRKM